MEGSASGGRKAVLKKLGALSRRGAVLNATATGAEVVTPEGARAGPARQLTADEFATAADLGWLRRIGAGQFALSTSGKNALRAAKHGGESTPRSPHPDRGDPQLVVLDRPGYNPDESPLLWLRRRKDRSGRPLISAMAYEAGERLRGDFFLAHMTPRVTSSWNPAPVARMRRSAPGAGHDMSDRALAARIRVERALDAVGPELSGVLIEVCCHNQGLEQAERTAGWPQRSGKVVLQLALQGLARHYGMDRSAPDGIRHWGSPDYRPTIRPDADNANSDSTNPRPTGG